MISDNFKVHYENLANARATLQTRERPVGTKIGLNTSLSKNPLRRSNEGGYHVSRGNKSLLSEHLLNIKHMNRRIHSIGSGRLM